MYIYQMAKGVDGLSYQGKIYTVYKRGLKTHLCNVKNIRENIAFWPWKEVDKIGSSLYALK